MDGHEQPTSDVGAGPWAKTRDRKKIVGRKASRYSVVGVRTMSIIVNFFSSIHSFFQITLEFVFFKFNQKISQQRARYHLVHKKKMRPVSASQVCMWCYSVRPLLRLFAVVSLKDYHLKEYFLRIFYIIVPLKLHFTTIVSSFSIPYSSLIWFHRSFFNTAFPTPTIHPAYPHHHHTRTYQHRPPQPKCLVQGLLSHDATTASNVILTAPPPPLHHLATTLS
jgi:hypothetical protein